MTSATTCTSTSGSTSPKQLPEGCILGMGNPLLDIASVVPQSLLDKFDLRLNNAILAEAAHAALYEELTAPGAYSLDFVAGGATQNSIRVAQWMGRTAGATSFLGAVGKDANGKKLQEVCEAGGVAPHYYESDDLPTGLCAVLIVDNERSMVTKLEAANSYRHAHTMTPKVQAVIDKAQIVYSAGFFLTLPDGPESMLHVAEHCCKNNKIYCLNLAAEFLIQFFAEPMNKVLKYTDFVFANETEAACFGESRKWGKDLPTIALKLSSLAKESGARARTVVITQGGDPTIIAHNGKVTLYPVPPLAKELMVDTCGAGDAFVGGFLARLAADLPMEECVRAGHYAARVVIQQSGCTMPAQPDI